MILCFVCGAPLEVLEARGGERDEAWCEDCGVRIPLGQAYPPVVRLKANPPTVAPGKARRRP